MRNPLWRWFGRDNGRRLRILLIDDALPDVTIGAGIPLLVEMLRALDRTAATVTYWPTLERAYDRPDPGDVAAHGAIIVTEQDGGLGCFLASQARPFDGIIVSRPHNMRAFREAVEKTPGVCGTPTLIYNAEALFAEREIVRRVVIGRPMDAAEAERLVAGEVSLADGTDIVLAVNERTVRAFADRGHRDVRLLGYAVVPRPSARPYDRRKGFILVGPTYTNATPNTDSVVWFVDQVLPRLRQALTPDVELTLVGDARARDIHDRVGAGLRLKGVVPDLRKVYARARVFVAPTRFAAGIPLKVYDAVAHGVPVVMTSLLAGQIGWTHDREALVADSAEDFADACRRLHEDRRLWLRIRSNALARIKGDAGGRRFDRVIAGVIADIASGRHDERRTDGVSERRPPSGLT